MAAMTTDPDHLKPSSTGTWFATVCRYIENTVDGHRTRGNDHERECAGDVDGRAPTNGKRPDAQHGKLWQNIVTWRTIIRAEPGLLHRKCKNSLWHGEDAIDREVGRVDCSVFENEIRVSGQTGLNG